MNLNDIKGVTPLGLPVQADDVIDVPHTAVKIPGHALYYAVQGPAPVAPAALMVGGVP